MAVELRLQPTQFGVPSSQRCTPHRSVCLPGHLDHARRLRADLPDHVCLWVNAAEGHTYDDADAAAWTELDPAVCDCHIGCVHLETLPLYDVFAGGVLERVPAGHGTAARLSGR